MPLILLGSSLQQPMRRLTLCSGGEQEAYFVVDTMYGQLPQLTKDMFWDQDVVDLPVTQATHAYKKVNFEGSAAGIRYDSSRVRWSNFNREITIYSEIIIIPPYGSMGDT